MSDEKPDYKLLNALGGIETAIRDQTSWIVFLTCVLLGAACGITYAFFHK
jgi:hypothetical protein